MKKYLISLVTMFALWGVSPVFATQLPVEIKNYVIESVPKSTIRFDGLITMPDGTIYLPLLPAFSPEETSFGVKYTYPGNLAFVKKPEIIIFNNNYCLLKLIKNKTGFSVSDIKDFPIEVRSGLLPQDLLVPKGLVLPDTLVGVLGDLNIPLNSNLKIDTVKKNKIKQDLTQEVKEQERTIKVIEPLKDKLFFITNFNSNYIYIMPTEMRDVQYTLKLDSIPRAVKEIQKKFLLVSTNGKTYIDVVDIQNEEIAKQIDLGVVVDEILVTKDEKTAYVVSNSSSNLFVIDIPTMKFVKQIQIKGNPDKISFSDDETKLIYQDENSGDIYTVELNNNYVNIYQCNVPNASKLAIINNEVYVLSRTRHSLRIFPYQEYVEDAKKEEEIVFGSRKKHYIKDSLFATGPAVKNYLKKEEQIKAAQEYVEEGQIISTSLKPVDMFYYKEKLYILSSVTNSIDVFNPLTKQIEKTIPLNIAGFSNKFNEIKEDGLVIITNVVEKEYIVFDLNKQIVLQKNPIDLPMTTLTVVEKTKIEDTEKEKQEGVILQDQEENL